MGRVPSRFVLDTSKCGKRGASVGQAGERHVSPSRRSGGPTDARSDVYSIGVMAYEILTGKVPYDGESPLVIAMKHVSEPPPDELRR